MRKYAKGGHSVLWEACCVPVQEDHVYTDTDSLPSRILTACTFCQTEMRKSKSTKRGYSQTSRTIKVRKGEGNPRTPRSALHTHTRRSFSQLMLIADNGWHNLPCRKLDVVKRGLHVLELIRGPSHQAHQSQTSTHTLPR